MKISWKSKKIYEISRKFKNCLTYRESGQPRQPGQPANGLAGLPGEPEQPAWRTNRPARPVGLRSVWHPLGLGSACAPPLPTARLASAPPLLTPISHSDCRLTWLPGPYMATGGPVHGNQMACSGPACGRPVPGT